MEDRDDAAKENESSNDQDETSEDIVEVAEARVEGARIELNLAGEHGGVVEEGGDVSTEMDKDYSYSNRSKAGHKFITLS